MVRAFARVMKNGLFNLGKQALQSGVQVLDDFSGGKDLKVVIKRGAAEGPKKMNKKSISRALTRKIASHWQTLTGNGVTATKK